MTRRVLITGGLGYLGGRIAKGLLDDDLVEVTIVTRSRPPAKPPWLGTIKLATVDFDDVKSWQSLCEGMTDVIHLASMNAHDCGEQPDDAIRVNVMGTRRIVEAAVSSKVKRFIYMSSAHVYGNLAGNISEETIPCPRHPYAITKRAAEDFVLSASKNGVMEVVVFRLSNCYGVPAHAEIPAWTLLVNDLCRQAVVDRVFKLRSSGVQVRDFIPIGDVVRAVKHAFRMPKDLKGDGIFNLGGDYAVSIMAMAQTVAERCERILGFRPEIHHAPAQPTERSEQLNYCSEKLKATGFTLETHPEEEIDATILFCQKLYGAEKP